MGKIERLNISSVQELYNLVAADRGIKGFFGKIDCTGDDSYGDEREGTLYYGMIMYREADKLKLDGSGTGSTELYLDRENIEHTVSGYIYIYS